jgi:hypothetical protein
MSLFDSDDGVTFGPFGSKVWDLYARIREVVDQELMNFSEEELHMINLLYGENFSYPVHNHVTQLLTGVPSEETLH